MDIVNEQKLADAFAPVVKMAVDELLAKLPGAAQEALDGMTITVTITKRAAT